MPDFPYARAVEADLKARSFAAPPPDWTVAEHAEKRRKLSPETSSLHGNYRFDTTPFWREPAERVMDPDVERLKCVKGNQLGWSELLNCIDLYIIDLAPCGVIKLFPTRDDGTDWHSEKFVPMLRDSNMEHRINTRHMKDGQNTTNTNIRFPGGMITIVWSGSASKLSQRTRKIAVIEEPDRCLENVKDEGDPLKLIVKRTDTFHDRKIIIGGTPTVLGSSAILMEMETTDWRRYWIPCPHCGFHQYLDSSISDDTGEPTQLRWDRQGGGDTQVIQHPVWGDALPETAYLECANPELRCRINNDEKISVLGDGHWVPTRPFHGELGYDISSFYSPMGKATLETGVKEFLTAKKRAITGDFEGMKVFINTYCGRGYSAPAAEEVKIESIQHLRETMGDVLPEGVHYITCAVDPGGHRMDIEFVGHGEEDESWGLLYETLPYGMMDEESHADMFESLERLLFETEFQHPSGVVLTPEAYGIDTGSWTTQLYAWIKKIKREGYDHGNGKVLPEKRGHIYALKGEDGFNGVWVRKGSMSVVKQHGVWLYLVLTGAIKDAILHRLQRLKPGPGYMHVNRNYPPEWEAMMTSNRKYSKFKLGKEIFYYEKNPWERDEALDLRVYNEAVKYKDRFRIEKLPIPSTKSKNQFAPERKAKEQPEGASRSERIINDTPRRINRQRRTRNVFER